MKKTVFLIFMMLTMACAYAQVSVRLSNGSAFFNFIGNKPWINTPFFGSKGTYFADVNGDGKADIEAVNDDGITVRVSSGNQFLAFMGSKLFIAGAFFGSRGTYFADVNGDGKSDAIVVNDGGVTIRLCDGTQFLAPVAWTNNPYYGTRGTFFADLNGDGRADAIVVNDNGITVRLSDGSQFLPNASWTATAYYGSRGTFFADVNGDKKADAIVLNDNGVTVSLSDGTKFLPGIPWISIAYYGTKGTYFADVNGDGKADAVVVNENAITARISDGTKFLPNAAWTNGAFFGSRATYFSDVNGDGKADAIAVNGQPLPVQMVTRRISGARYLNFVKADAGDGYQSANGFLLVTHNPGCGIVGNDGADQFFLAAGKPLPAGCTVIREEFAQFWPQVRDFDSPWSWLDDAGSYGAVKQFPEYRVRWHNACVGAYNAKNLYYLVSFIVSMPEGTDLGEPAFDPNASMLNAFVPPGGYGWVEPPPPHNDQVPIPQPVYTNYYFKVSCPGEIRPCVTVLVPAVSLAIAKAYVQNMNANCTIEQTDLNGYSNACK